MKLPPRFYEIVASANRGRILWLTGAGISAESGIPTFRGPEGFWTIGSRNYQPQELATFAAFTQMPDEVWAWYLYRRAVCRAAAPNAAHRTLADIELLLGDRFLLITQNVDGLHLRAGNTPHRTYEIHGNIDFMRPVGGGATTPILESAFDNWPKDRRLTKREAAQLEGYRPHVLWFDEMYDEEHFRFESSLRATADAGLLIVVGTTGATNLPMQVGMQCAQRGVPLVVINPEPNPFSELVKQTGNGVFLKGKAGLWVPSIGEALAAASA